MLARIAQELFWLGRNLARAEQTSRLLDGVYQADLQGSPDGPSGVTLSWPALLAIMGVTDPGGFADFVVAAAGIFCGVDEHGAVGGEAGFFVAGAAADEFERSRIQVVQADAGVPALVYNDGDAFSVRGVAGV